MQMTKTRTSPQDSDWEDFVPEPQPDSILLRELRKHYKSMIRYGQPFSDSKNKNYEKLLKRLVDQREDDLKDFKDKKQFGNDPARKKIRWLTIRGCATGDWVVERNKLNHNLVRLRGGAQLRDFC